MYIIISWNITIWSYCNNYSSWQHPVGWKLFATLQFSFNFPSCKSSFIHIYPVGYFQYIFCGILVWHFECVWGKGEGVCVALLLLRFTDELKFAIRIYWPTSYQFTDKSGYLRQNLRFTLHPRTKSPLPFPTPNTRRPCIRYLTTIRWS